MVRDRALDPEVLAYYDQGRERSRLELGCRLEFLRTQELLRRMLPAPPVRVLDVGGAAGIHAIPLVRAGYDVTLIDPVPLHIDQARAAGLVRAGIGDARQLNFDDNSFGAVLLLGPLYHRPDRDDRLRALQEARRVAGPDGVVIAALISRFASTFDGLFRGFLLDPVFAAIVDDDLGSGCHRNPAGTPHWFTTAYFHDPAEVRLEFDEGGCPVSDILAIEGPASNLPDVDDWLDDPTRRELLLQAIRRVETHPSLLGASTHLLVISQALQR